MEFTEAESNMNDLVSEYQQYQADRNRMLKPACRNLHTKVYSPRLLACYSTVECYCRMCYIYVVW